MLERIEKTGLDRFLDGDYDVARCAETGARLSRGNGRSKLGTAPRYYIHVPTGEIETWWSEYLQTERTREINEVATVRAWNDAAAIELANGKLPKIIKKIANKKLQAVT